jgi:hypothetical protein
MKSLTRILLLAALASLMALPALTAPAQAAKKMEAALQDDGVFIFNADIGREAAFARAYYMGATTIRMNILWWQAVPTSQRNQTSVPSNITYNFGIWDTAIARAKAWGLKVQLDLAGDPPAWACGNKKVPYACDGYKPNVRLWKGFVKAAARHFKGKVKRFSLWNEPNWYTWISPHKKAPILYRELVQAGYKQIKRVSKKMEVVAGELAPHFQPGISTPPLQFVREMVCVNKKLKRTKNANRKCGKKPLKFDAFSTHPYDFEHKPTFERDNKDEVTVSNLPALTKLLDKLRKKGLIKTKKKRFPIYLTEHGYMVQNPQVKPARQTPESKRKRRIVKAWKIAQGTPRIKEMLHYDFVSPPPGSPDGYFDMGLLTNSGAVRESYTKLGEWILDARADGKIARQRSCSACG